MNETIENEQKIKHFFLQFSIWIANRHKLKGNFDEKQDREKNTQPNKRNETAISPQDRVAFERAF